MSTWQDSSIDAEESGEGGDTGHWTGYKQTQQTKLPPFQAAHNALWGEKLLKIQMWTSASNRQVWDTRIVSICARHRSFPLPLPETWSKLNFVSHRKILKLFGENHSDAFRFTVTCICSAGKRLMEEHVKLMNHQTKNMESTKGSECPPTHRLTEKKLTNPRWYWYATHGGRMMAKLKLSPPDREQTWVARELRAVGSTASIHRLGYSWHLRNPLDDGTPLQNVLSNCLVLHDIV